MKTRKIYTIFIMLLLFVTAANAKTDKYASSFGTPSSNATYSGTTFSWTAGNSNSMKVLGNLKGNVDLSKYKFLHVNISDKAEGTSGFRLLIYCDNNGSTTSYIGEYYSSTEIHLDLTTITLTTPDHTYANINNIFIAGLGNSGSFTLTPADVYLETEEYEYMSIATTLDASSDVYGSFQWYKEKDEGITACTEYGTTITNNFGNSDNGVIFGYANNNSLANGYIDLTGYDNVTVNLNAYVDGNNKEVRLLAGAGSNNTFNSFSADKLSITQALTATKVTSIKAGAGASNCQNVKSVVFTKEYLPSSTTEFTIAGSTKSAVSYDRTFTVGRKSTVCLPFTLTADEAIAAGTFYELASIEGGSLHFNEVAEPQAYVPYVFEPSTAKPFVNLTNKTIEASKDATTEVTGATFVGTLAHVDALTGGNNTLYGFNAANGEFVKVGSNVSIDAFRAYISVPGEGAAKLAAHFGDVATGIEDITVQQHNRTTTTYNLAGQRVSPHSGAKGLGIVIINGKKYVVK